MGALGAGQSLPPKHSTQATCGHVREQETPAAVGVPACTCAPQAYIYLAEGLLASTSALESARPGFSMAVDLDPLSLN